jgi:hypothetical protein
MTGSASPFDRITLELAFERLGVLANLADKIVEISVYGGSALVLSMDFRIATRDVDAVFESDRAFVREAAASVAKEFGWDANWINDGVKGFLSDRDGAPEAKKLFRSYPSETGPGLRIFVASPAYLFSMKCLAMRIGGTVESGDVSDIRHLGELLGIRNSADAMEIVARYYPANSLPPKTRFGIEEIFSKPGTTDPG